jgi:hypothetical protein
LVGPSSGLVLPEMMELTTCTAPSAR